MRLALLAICAALVFGQSEQFVSSGGLGEGVKLYEWQFFDRLVFALDNRMDLAVDEYVLQTCVTGPQGVRCPCTIRSKDNSIAAKSKASLPEECIVPVDTKMRTPLAHSTRILELRLANGFEWKRPVTITVPLDYRRK